MCKQLDEITATEQALRSSVALLQHCPDISVPDAYHAVVSTTEHLFWLEQELMEAYDFPSRQSHLEQHARVLRGLHCAHSEVLRGSVAHARHAGGKLLLDWLTLHRDTMHAVFTIWMSYCDNGLLNKQTQPHEASFIAH